MSDIKDDEFSTESTSSRMSPSGENEIKYAQYEWEDSVSSESTLFWFTML